MDRLFTIEALLSYNYYHKKIMIGDYKIGKLIGEGAFSKVKLGVHTSTGQKVAIKIIDKKLMFESAAKSNQEKRKRAIRKGLPTPQTEQAGDGSNKTVDLINKLENEVQLLMRLDHPNIIKTYQVIDGKDECYVVMQYAAGGEMMEYLAAKQLMNESEARKFFAQLISGLEHIHAASIVHRDLKLENLLLDEKNNLMITDFGLGRTVQGVELLDTFCGTPHYAAQELICGIPYVGVLSDIWALGVILYFFVAGTSPFHGESIQELYDNIKSVRYHEPDFFSPELSDLLKKILKKNPLERMTLKEIMEHPWLHLEGRLDIPLIPPKISGKVEASQLGQIVKSINSEHEFIIYTFNYDIAATRDHEKQAIKGRQRSNSAAIVRKKSISIVNGTRPVFEGVVKENCQVVELLADGVGNFAPPIARTHTRTRRRATIFGNSNGKGDEPSINNNNVSASLSKTVASSANSSLKSENMDSGNGNFNFGSGNSNSVCPEIFLEQVSEGDTFGEQMVKRESLFSETSPSAGNFLQRRLSMISPPTDEKSNSFAEDSYIAQIGIDALQMTEIEEWHQIHRPPKEIRVVKFAFRKGTSSAVLDPSTMFQDLHSVITSLDETKEKQLIFTRHPDYYNFCCTYSVDKTNEPLRFDVEICKVWLLEKVHAVKIKRRVGDAIKFKFFYEKIVAGLNWKN